MCGRRVRGPRPFTRPYRRHHRCHRAAKRSRQTTRSTSTKIKDIERSKSLEQLTEIDVSLQGIADTWADEDGQQTVRFVREKLVILQQQKLITLDHLGQQSEAVETTLKSLLDATRTLAEDINFDVLIGVATAADSTKEELDKTKAPPPLA